MCRTSPMWMTRCSSGPTRDGEDWRELAAREIELFRADMAALRVLPPDHFVGAVEALPLIEEFAAVLADRGVTVRARRRCVLPGSADPDFGSVSGLGVDEMIELSAERGGDPARPGKKDPLDPLVWLTARPGEPSWPSGFGPGRPGWHVECAAIATGYLGVAFDVQAGGSDLIFPHHEMSASHARVALGRPATGGRVFARRYVHAGMVRLGGEKMSKSLGNLVFVSGCCEAGADPMAIRLAILAHHYRRTGTGPTTGLAAAQARLARWRAAVAAGRRRRGRAGRLAGAGRAVLAGGPRADRRRPGRPGALAGRGRLGRGGVAAGAAEAGAAGLAGTGESAAEPGLAAGRPGLARPGSAGALVRDAVDALLGVAL